MSLQECFMRRTQSQAAPGVESWLDAKAQRHESAIETDSP